MSTETVERLDIHSFSKNNIHVVYDVTLNKVYVVKKDVYDYIQQLKNVVPKEGIPKKYQKFVNKLSRYQGETTPEQDRRIVGLTAFINQKCNMRCVYCYGKDGSYGAPMSEECMSEATLFKTINFLMKVSGDAPVVNFTFFGGEPLLSLDLMKSGIKYAREKAKENNKKILINFITNGILLKPEVTQYFIDNDVFVALSIDGDKDINDDVRMYGNKSHHDVVVNNLAPFKNKLDVSIRATLTNRNFRNMNETITHFSQLGWNRVVLERVAKGGADELLLTEEYNGDLFKEYDRVIERLTNDIGFFDRKIIMPFAMVFLRLAFRKQKDYHYCSAGRWSIAVDTQGNVYPCHRLAGNKNYTVGDVSKEFDYHVFDNFFGADINSRNDCKACWARYLCGGGCLREPMIHGDIMQPLPNICTDQKKIYEIGIYSFAKLGWFKFSPKLPALYSSNIAKFKLIPLGLRSLGKLKALPGHRWRYSDYSRVVNMSK